MKAKIEEANQEAVSRIQRGKPTLIDVSIAGEAIPGMKRNMILHAGPPVTWERMCGPMKGAVIGGMILEGLVKKREEAEALAASGGLFFRTGPPQYKKGPL